MCHNVMKGVSYDTQLFENPLTVVSKVVHSFRDELVDRLPRWGIGEWLSESVNQFNEYTEFSYTDLKHVIFIAVGLTIIRYIINAVLLKRIPEWVKMAKGNAIKFPESTFNATMYAIAWVWELYIFSTSPKNLFFNLASHWNGWEKGSRVEPEVYWLFMFQIGFYLHFLYATVFVNTKRKDFAVLVLHHVLTITLIGWSYAVRFHFVGLVLLFLHDIGDVLLELGKSIKYFEELDGKKISIADVLANVLFGVFTLQWILCRLYWYPMKVLQSSATVSMIICPAGAFYLPFNIMLVVLYLMQVYWFYFILRLLYKVLIKRENVDDNREYDVEDKSRKKEEVKKKK